MLGLAVTLGAVATVLWEAGQPQSPSSLTARITDVTQTTAGQVAEISVSNAGDDTAAAVEVEGSVGQEVAHVTLDYVPGHGQAKAHLRFAGDPRKAQLRVVGWAAP